MPVTFIQRSWRRRSRSSKFDLETNALVPGQIRGGCRIDGEECAKATGAKAISTSGTPASASSRIASGSDPLGFLTI